MEQKLKIDFETGKLFWINPPKHHSDLLNKEAGNLQKNLSGKNYWVVQVDGKKYRRSQIVFYLANGYWAKPCIDHINGNSTDDRPINLRQATITQNAWNHKKRARRIQLPIGVRKLASGKFQARIGYFGKQLHLGSFQSPDEASTIYQLKRKELYGKFA
jgi:hypothetical protein